MKLKSGFVTHNYKDQQLMVAVGPKAKQFHGLVRSNQTAAFIIDRLKQETSEEEIVAAMTEAYAVDTATAASDVHRILEQLGEIGALEL